MVARHRRIATLVAVLAVAAACSGGETDPPGAQPGTGSGPATTGAVVRPGSGFNEAQFDGKPADGGRIRFGVESNIATLDPAFSIAQPADVDTSLAIYDALITYDDKGKLAPSLATRWSNSADLKTWTIELRRGVTFSDGTRFDAGAVVKHFQRLKDPATGCTCVNTVAPITSVVASEPSTVVFTLSEPNAFFTSTLAGSLGFIVSPAAVAKYGKDYGRHPTGTGPFVLSSFDSLVLKKNPTYWRKDDDGRRLPYVDEIQVKPIPDARVRLQALQSGDVDIIQTADTGTLVDAVKAGKFEVQKVTGSSATITIFNVKKPPFNDRRMRLAVNHALNRDELNNVLYQGSRQPAYSPFAADSPYYADIDWPKYDPAEARKLVAAAKADGVPLTYTATCIATDEARRGLTSTQAGGRKVGLRSTLEFQDQGAFVNRVLSGSGDYQVACFRSPQIADADGLYNSLHTGGSVNVMGYSNKTVDKALEDIRETTDEAEHIRLLRIVQERLATDVPTFPTLYDIFGNIYSPKVSGLPVPQANSLGAIKFATLYLKA